MRLHRAFIDAASDAEVGHLVYLSFVNARPGELLGQGLREQQWYARRFRRPVELDHHHAAEPAPAEAPEGRRNIGSR